MIDFQLMRFLDRFVYRNPKTKTDKHTERRDRGAVRRKVYDPIGVKKLAVSSKVSGDTVAIRDLDCRSI